MTFKNYIFKKKIWKANTDISYFVSDYEFVLNFTNLCQFNQNAYLI